MSSVPSSYTFRFKEAYKLTAKAVYEMSLCAFEVHDRYGYQAYVDWLKAEFNLSRQTGDNLLNVYRNIISTPNFSVDNIIGFAPSALYLLAQPATPREAFEIAVEQATQGETVTRQKAEQIVEAVKGFQLAQVATNNPLPPSIAVKASTQVVREATKTGSVTIKTGAQVPITPVNLKQAAVANISAAADRQRGHVDENKPIITASGSVGDVLRQVADALAGYEGDVRIVVRAASAVAERVQ